MDNRPTIIGIAGPAGAGKSSLAKVLVERLPDAAVFSFAHALKTECDPILRERLGISAWTQDRAEKRIIRDFLVARGAGRRAEDPYYWINKLAAAIADSDFATVIIDDVRYRNEALWIHSQGGRVLGVSRQGFGPANSEEARSLAEFSPDIQVPETWFNDHSILSNIL